MGSLQNQRDDMRGRMKARKRVEGFDIEGDSGNRQGWASTRAYVGQAWREDFFGAFVDIGAIVSERRGADGHAYAVAVYHEGQSYIKWAANETEAYELRARFEWLLKALVTGGPTDKPNAPRTSRTAYDGNS